MGDSLDYLDDKRLYSFPKGILLLPVDLPPVDIHEKYLSLSLNVFRAIRHIDFEDFNCK